MEVEEGTVGADGFVHTASPPYPGVTITGTYICGYGGTPTGTVAGHIETTTGINDDGSSFAVLSSLGGGAAVGEAFSLTAGFIIDLFLGNNGAELEQIPRVGPPQITKITLQVQTTGYNDSVVSIGTLPPMPTPQITGTGLVLNPGQPPVLRLMGKNLGNPQDNYVVSFQVGAKDGPGPVFVVHGGKDAERDRPVHRLERDRCRRPGRRGLGRIPGVVDPLLHRERRQSVLRREQHRRGQWPGQLWIRRDRRRGLRLRSHRPEQPGDDDLAGRAPPLPRRHARRDSGLRRAPGEAGIAVIDAETLQRVDVGTDSGDIELPAGAVPFEIAIDPRDDMPTSRTRCRAPSTSSTSIRTPTITINVSRPSRSPRRRAWACAASP